MRPSLHFPTLLLALLAGPVLAGSLAEVEIYDRTAGQSLPVYEHEGRRYVAGEPRHQYELRIRNRGGGRVLAVTSVDGVNVITGETAAQQQSGYVLGAFESVDIEGWRKSLDDVATFYFTRLSDSYAARTGRPQNVGVIGVALFSERRVCCHHYLEERSAIGEEPQEPAAPASADERERDSSGGRRSSPQLGTGHGPRESSPAQYVDFQRASETPDETVVIYYDSRRNLVAQGILPERPHLADRRPEPFPKGFVPDP
jgi:hypothetical protein